MPTYDATYILHYRHSTLHCQSANGMWHEFPFPFQDRSCYIIEWALAFKSQQELCFVGIDIEIIPLLWYDRSPLDPSYSSASSLTRACFQTAKS